MKENNSKRKILNIHMKRIWDAFLYLFITDDFKIMKSDKQLLKFSILYKIVYWICIFLLILTCIPFFGTLLAYTLKSSKCSNMTIEAHIYAIESFVKLFMLTTCFPFLIGTIAYFRIRHIQSIKFYRKKLNINS